ncbi:MAG: M20/M25/M40 family metallo-hydrolase [Bacillus sp. (in: firmicutes)]
MKTYMQTPDQMLELLTSLVSYKSITHSEDEKRFPLLVEQHLMQVPYFRDNPSLIENHFTTDGRLFLTALYKHPEAEKTVVLISHFDVVDVADYGDLQHLAFLPEELTNTLHSRKRDLPEDAKADLESGDWLFGRGTMDMKCGLVQHMSLLERAAAKKWKVNLLLLTVPDEEVNSVGMREAVPELLNIADKHNLTITLFLNSEPMFTQTVGDQGHYYYTGTIGKILPSIYCLGKETHVGEPLSGMNAAWMTSFFTQEIEWNPAFCETVDGETSPPPTILWQRDIKKDYSAQIPHRSVSMYNILLMKRNPGEIMELFYESALEAAKKIETVTYDRFNTFGVTSMTPPKVKVLTYEELKQEAISRTSDAYITSLEHSVAKERNGDNREQAVHIVDQLATICQDMAPMAVLFFAPPYYPAVYSGEETAVQELANTLTVFAKEQFGYDLQPVSYFNGISDLSYVKLNGSLNEMEPFNNNLPGDNELYYIPFEDISRFNAPVLNVGPIGRDAHKNTERLYLPFAFEELPQLLTNVIKAHKKQEL